MHLLQLNVEGLSAGKCSVSHSRQTQQWHCLPSENSRRCGLCKTVLQSVVSPWIAANYMAGMEALYTWEASLHNSICNVWKWEDCRVILVHNSVDPNSGRGNTGNIYPLIRVYPLNQCPLKRNNLRVFYLEVKWYQPYSIDLRGVQLSGVNCTLYSTYGNHSDKWQAAATDQL